MLRHHCHVQSRTLNGPKEIINLWEKHYREIFNCLPKVSYGSNFELEESYDKVKVKIEEIISAIKSLDDNKSCALDGIFAEHMKYMHLIN